jgi:hypothetical protein
MLLAFNDAEFSTQGRKRSAIQLNEERMVSVQTCFAQFQTLNIVKAKISSTE